MKLVSIVLLLFLIGAALPAQEAEPYEEGEFPPWARDLRRAEIISLGVYPMAYLFTTLCYDIYRFTRESIEMGRLAPQYAPLFFAPPNAPGHSKEERRGIFFASISVAGLVGVVDYILGRLEERPNRGER